MERWRGHYYEHVFTFAQVRVESLMSYPVKGCSGVELDSCRVTAAGLRHDRRFMVVDVEGRARTQREIPGLAAIQPALDEAGDHLTLAAPGVAPLAIPVRRGSRVVPVALFGERYEAVDQGEEARRWLSAYVGGEVRLVRVGPRHRRVTTGAVAGTSGFADSCAIHLISRESVSDLNARLVARGSEPVGVERFRANVVVSGGGEPYYEDRLEAVALGSAWLRYAKPAMRCTVVTVDQGTGRRTGSSLLKALAAYRRHPGGLAFGVKLVVRRPGWADVGDLAGTVSGPARPA